MRHFFSSEILFFVLALNVIASDSCDQLAVFWVSQPVEPGEIVYVQGYGLTPQVRVELGRLEDGFERFNFEMHNFEDIDFKSVEIEQAVGTSLKFTLPQADSSGIYAMRISGKNDIQTDIYLINTPDVWWMQGSKGEYKATNGGWLRLFGNYLSMNSVCRVALHNGATLITLDSTESGQFAAEFALPSNLSSGNYDVFVHNGAGKRNGWENAGKIEIVEDKWKTDIFKVTDRNGEAIQKALNEAADNGGGVVYLPAGRYVMNEIMLQMPEFVTLRGEHRDLVTLLWRDTEQPPPALIRGIRSFAIEDLSIVSGNHQDGIQVERTFDPHGRGDVHIRRVYIHLDRISHVSRRGQSEEDRRRRIQERLWTPRYAAIRLGGENVSIVDSEITTRNVLMNVVAIYLDRVKGALLSGNKTISSYRIGFYITGCRNLIIEDNDFTGGLFVGTHHSNSLLNMYCNNVYFANNKQRYALMHDMEIMSLDSHRPAGAYLGTIESVDGLQIKLSSDPLSGAAGISDGKWTRWDGTYQGSEVGAGVYILQGKGAGQYRRVVSGQERTVNLDSPWQIDPDQNSIISIAKYHGRFLFIGNSFRDGGNFQLWGGNLNSIVYGNKFYRTGVVISRTGLIYGGLMPDWYSQFIANESFQAGNIGTSTYDYDAEQGLGGHIGEAARSESFLDYDYMGDGYAGPVARGVIHRRNIHHTGSIYIHGGVDGGVVENCKSTRSHAHIAPRGVANPINILQRGNKIINPSQVKK